MYQLVFHHVLNLFHTRGMFHLFAVIGNYFGNGTSLSKTGEFPDIPKNILKEEFSLASRAGEGRMGETHLFYRYFINVKYIAWSRIRKAYLRVESGESGEFLLKEFYLMLQLDDESRLPFQKNNGQYALRTPLLLT